MFTEGNQRTEKAFCNWLICLFLFMKALIGTRDKWMLLQVQTKELTPRQQATLIYSLAVSDLRDRTPKK